MKRIKKTIISLLAATTVFSSALISTTANATLLPVTRDFAVDSAVLNRSTYTDPGVPWCAHFISELFGFSEDTKGKDGTRYCSSVTTIVLDCIDQKSTAFGTFHCVADNNVTIKNYEGRTGYQDKENYTPKVGDLVVYEETTWNYNEQKASYEKMFPSLKTNELEHIGIIVAIVNGKIYTVEGNYTMNFDMRDYGDDYGAAVEGYANASLNPQNKAKEAVYVTNVNEGFIYGYISPFYKDLKGDVDSNGTVDIADLALLKQYVFKDVVTINRKNSDVNKDEVVDLTDLTLLSLYLLNNRW